MISNLLTKSASFTEILLAVVIIILTVLLSKHIIRLCRSRGPWGIPILGFYPFLQKDHHAHLTALAKKYGDPYVFSMLGVNYLHMNSIKVAKEVAVSQADCFAERPDKFSLFHHVFEGGLLFLNGEAWRVLRKFLIQSMREIGLGAKDSMAKTITESLQETLKILEETKGKPINITALLSEQCMKVIRYLVLGYDVSDDIVQKMNEEYVKVLTPMRDVGLIIVGDLAKHLVAPRLEGFSQIFDAKKKLDSLFLKVLEDHKKNFDPNDPKDLIDIYLREKKTKEEKNDPQAKYFTDKAFLPTLLQVYGDGGESVGLILAWFIKELAERPDVQDKMYAEIIQEIGTDRLPTLEDRQKLPLINSIMKEMERMSTMVPLFVNYECSRDTTVSGVFVPKGTVTLLNYVSAHRDPSVYKDPDTFNPERFLPDENTKRTKEEMPMQFGVGRRACPGEQMVLTEIFMFLTMIFQRFTLQTIKDQNEDPTKNVIENLFQYEVKLLPREHKSPLS